MIRRGSASSWSLLIVVVIIAAAMLWALWPDDKSFEEATGLSEISLWQEIKQKVVQEAEKIEATAVSSYERQQIKVWITQEGLNEFGDSAETVYTGGTPLFNEATGETIDKYDYIVSQHPDRPWKQY